MSFRRLSSRWMFLKPGEKISGCQCIDTHVPHCCEQMKSFVEDCRVHIEYGPVYREYAIHGSDDRGITVQQIYFCPWCGKKLPQDLRDRWFDEMDLLKIDPHEEESKIPSEFKTDEWWKKRRL